MKIHYLLRLAQISGTFSTPGPTNTSLIVLCQSKDLCYPQQFPISPRTRLIQIITYRSKSNLRPDWLHKRHSQRTATAYCFICFECKRLPHRLSSTNALILASSSALMLSGMDAGRQRRKVAYEGLKMISSSAMFAHTFFKEGSTYTVRGG